MHMPLNCAGSDAPVRPIHLTQLLIYVPTQAESPYHFVDYWSQQYQYPDESLYSHNIGRPQTPGGFRELFKWKMGKRFFVAKEPLIKRCFISRCDEARRLLVELCRHGPVDKARVFLARFRNGGAVWRIFWLHCWDAHFPIYD